MQARCGSSGRPTPTHHLPIELRKGRRPRRPVASQVAGDHKGRPYGGVTRSAVRWADVGIGPYEFLFSWGLHI